MLLTVDSFKDPNRTTVPVTVLRCVKPEEVSAKLQARIFNILKKGVYGHKVGRVVNLGSIARAIALKYDLPFVTIRNYKYAPEIAVTYYGNLPSTFNAGILQDSLALLRIDSLTVSFHSKNSTAVKDAIFRGLHEGIKGCGRAGYLVKPMYLDHVLDISPMEHKFEKTIIDRLKDILVARYLFQMKAVVDVQKVKQAMHDVFNSTKENHNV